METRQRGDRGCRVGGRRQNNLKKKLIDKALFENFKNEKACDHVWSMIWQSVMASACLHRRNVGCTFRAYPYIPQCTWCVETIHRTSLRDVQLFMYIHVHGSSLLTITTMFGQPGVYKVYISMNSLFLNYPYFLKAAFVGFLSGKYSFWKLKTNLIFIKFVIQNEHH